MKSSLKLVILFKLFEGVVIFELVVVLELVAVFELFEGGVVFELIFELFQLVVLFVFQSSTGLRFSKLEFF